MIPAGLTESLCVSVDPRASNLQYYEGFGSQATLSGD